MTAKSEVSSAVAATPVVWWWGIGLGVATGALLLSLDPDRGFALAVLTVPTAVVAVLDQATGRIANRHSVALFAITLVVLGAAAFIGDAGSVGAMLAGSVLWSVPFFVMAFVGAAGGGDFKFAATLGALTGWLGFDIAAIGLLAGVATCAGAGVAVAVRRRSMKHPVRLGLPLWFGATATLAWALM